LQRTGVQKIENEDGEAQLARIVVSEVGIALIEDCGGCGADDGRVEFLEE
jgi:hypothetical protein